MSHLLRYIEESNERFLDKIVDLIKDDHEWLEKLGISVNEKVTKVKTAIRKQLSNPENEKTIDYLLNYVVNDCLCELEQIALITLYTSADCYTQHSALFVYKCSNLYFCYSIGVDSKSIITKDPEDFCMTAAITIIDNFELEKVNLSDEWFKDSDVTNELTLNFNFKE